MKPVEPIPMEYVHRPVGETTVKEKLNQLIAAHNELLASYNKHYHNPSSQGFPQERNFRPMFKEPEHD